MEITLLNLAELITVLEAQNNFLDNNEDMWIIPFLTT